MSNYTLQKKLLTLYGPFFMDGIQLFQDCRATSCRQFIFTNLPVYQFLPISQFTFYLGVPGTHLIDLRGMKG